MRLQTVLIWVVIAGLLAGLVALTRSRHQASERAQTASTWTIPIDAARVATLRRTVPGSPPMTAARSGPDAWSLAWSDAAAQPRVWKADPGRVRAALRLLSTAEIILSPDRHDLTPTTTVEVAESDGRSVEIWFGPRAAGGQTPVVVLVKGADGVAQRRVDGRIGSGVPDAFVRADWSLWRDPTLFDASAASTQALSIRTGTHRVRVERTARGWAITEPFAIEADAAEIERTIGVLSGLRAASFDDTAPADELTGLNEPLAVIRIETSAGARTLEVGGVVETSGNMRFGRITAGEQSAAIRFDLEGLARISARPEVYARRIPVAVGIADIGGVRFLGPDGRVRVDAAREAGEWRINNAPAPPSQRDAIDRVVRVLTAEPANRVSFGPTASDPAGELGTVELRSREGVTIASVALRTERAGDSMRLIAAIRRGEGSELTWTSVSDQAKAVVAWAAALAAGG